VISPIVAIFHADAFFGGPSMMVVGAFTLSSVSISARNYWQDLMIAEF
jgi:hypothetical protein